MYTYFSLACASDGTAVPFPLAYILITLKYLPLPYPVIETRINAVAGLSRSTRGFLLADDLFFAHLRLESFQLRTALH